MPWKQGLSQSAVNRYLAVLSQLLHKAVEWDWLEKPPIKVKKYKESAGRIHYLSKEQVETLLNAAKADEHPCIYPFILIGLETGMRRMEILSIRLENIYLERQIISQSRSPRTTHLCSSSKLFG
jgi:integrase